MPFFVLTTQYSTVISSTEVAAFDRVLFFDRARTGDVLKSRNKAAREYQKLYLLLLLPANHSYIKIGCGHVRPGVANGF